MYAHNQFSFFFFLSFTAKRMKLNALCILLYCTIVVACSARPTGCVITSFVLHSNLRVPSYIVSNFHQTGHLWCCFFALLSSNGAPLRSFPFVSSIFIINTLICSTYRAPAGCQVRRSCLTSFIFSWVRTLIGLRAFLVIAFHCNLQRLKKNLQIWI